MYCIIKYTYTMAIQAHTDTITHARTHANTHTHINVFNCRGLPTLLHTNK